MNVSDSTTTLPATTREPRYFSMHQANRSLVLLDKIVGDVVSGYTTLIDLEERIEAAEQQGHFDQLDMAREDLVTTIDGIQNCLEEIQQLGVELRDFNRGIVDFPARHEDRDIRFCWKLGEPRIQYWHEKGDGFASRQPVSLLEWPMMATP